MPVPRVCPAGRVCDVTGVAAADQPCPEGHFCLEGTATTATTCGHPRCKGYYKGFVIKHALKSCNQSTILFEARIRGVSSVRPICDWMFSRDLSPRLPRWHPYDILVLLLAVARVQGYFRGLVTPSGRQL